ncbi:MAG: META domain-containing protein [Calditrichia bacterium]
MHGCSSSSVSPVPDELYRGNWVLFSSPLTGFQKSNILNINFKSTGKISGNGRCNSFGGDFTANGNRINMSITTMTEVHCGDEQAAEDAFFRMLEDAEYYSIAGECLIFSDSQQEELAIFKSDEIN